MYVHTNPHFMYSSSSVLTCRLKWTGAGWGWKNPSFCEVRVAHEVQVESAVLQLSIKNDSQGIEQESVRSYMYINTERSDSWFTVLDPAILLTKLFRCAAERYTRRFVKLRHCDSLDIKTILCDLKSVTSCSEAGRESSCEILESDGFLKKEVQIGEKGSASGSILYRNKVVEVVERQTEMCSRKERLPLWTTDKESVFYPMVTGFFRTLRAGVHHRVLWTSAGVVFWSVVSPHSSRSFSGFYANFIRQNGDEFEELRTRCMSGACFVAQFLQET